MVNENGRQQVIIRACFACSALVVKDPFMTSMLVFQMSNIGSTASIGTTNDEARGQVFTSVGIYGVRIIIHPMIEKQTAK